MIAPERYRDYKKQIKIHMNKLPLINGQQHSWSSIEVSIAGNIVTGITAVNYSDSVSNSVCDYFVTVVQVTYNDAERIDVLQSLSFW